jgi:hypothetical protein
VRTDEDPAPAALPDPRLARLARLTGVLFLALAFLPPLAGADLSAHAGSASTLEWISGARTPGGEAGVLESGSAGAPEAKPQIEAAPEAQQSAPEPDPQTASPQPQAGPIIGTNDGAGWGHRPARRLIEAGIRWNRIELGSSTPNTLQTSLHDGFQNLAVAGNIDDSTPLSSIEPREWGAKVASELRGRPGIELAEAGNEMYLKGGTANPVQYGHMYLAALEAMAAQGVHTRLLFNMTGDYPTGGGWSSPKGWSGDAQGGGWLRSAVAGTPGLAAAIAANGISIHPYGAVGENAHDSFGTAAPAADEAVARAVLGRIPPFYITEFGYDMGRCGRPLGACSERDQAQKMRAAYDVFEADPNIAGIWWYQSHDDDTGHWGLMNDDNTLRPSFSALSGLARLAGQ